MATLDALRDLHDGCNGECLRTHCRSSASACTLTWPAGTAIAIACDRCLAFSGDEVRPDFVVLDLGHGPSPARWIVVEMKRRLSSAHQAVAQLQAGADVIATEPQFGLHQAPRILLPLVLKARRAHGATVLSLRGKHVVFRGQRFPVVVKPCGASTAHV